MAFPGMPPRIPRASGWVDLVLSWFRQLWAAIFRVLGQFGSWIAWPFRMLWRLFWRQNRWFKLAVGVIVAPFLIGHLYFFWNAAWIRGYDVNYIDALALDQRTLAPTVVGQGAAGVCGRSYVVDATAELIDFNVNQNLWIPSNPFYKMGFLFLLDWEQTKFLDNKAAFQLGVHQAVQRTVTELTDTIGRVRGTAEADSDLTQARGSVTFDRYTWIFNPFSERPFGPTTRTPTYYENAREALVRYQDRLVQCQASFDARADNLLQFIDRIAADIGSTTALLLARTETHHSGWFDTQADNLFMYAKGEMYAYYGILAAARADFLEIATSRGLLQIWDNMMLHLRQAIEMDPMLISNARDDAWLMPNHLATIGFYILRARSNLVEIRSVLDR
jgi:hypothetical protein